MEVEHALTKQLHPNLPLPSDLRALTSARANQPPDPQRQIPLSELIAPRPVMQHEASGVSNKTSPETQGEEGKQRKTCRGVDFPYETWTRD